jgi:hypothetical protein
MKTDHTETQLQKTLDYLLTGCRITARECDALTGSMNLRTIISKLKNRHQFNIRSEYKTYRNENGVIVPYKEYWIKNPTSQRIVMLFKRFIKNTN